jgi:1-acyl-sn-glycerol-3-phosphate acyltransferase
MSHVVFFVLKWTCGLRYVVEGRENLPAGNHVIFMKHSSTWETYAIMILFEPLVWVMKREILWIPFVGWGCLLARCIAINRRAGASAVNQVSRRARTAWAVRRLDPIFPEHARCVGRRGVTGRAARCWRPAGCKIVPVAHNAGYFWRAPVLKRGTIAWSSGRPLSRRARRARVNEEVQTWIGVTWTQFSRKRRSNRPGAAGLGCRVLFRGPLRQRQSGKLAGTLGR